MTDSDRDKVKDVVCGMLVDAGDHEVMHQGMRFSFCSAQCRERFVANPGLYVGKPGKAAPRQRGQVERRRRSIRLESPLRDDEARLVVEHLQVLMGVEKVSLQGRQLEITYDLLQATLVQIERALVEVGARLGQGWAERLRRSFLHFAEDVQIDALEVPGSGSSRGGHRGCH